MYLGNAMLPSKQTRLKQNLIAKVTNLIENAKEKLQKDKISVVLGLMCNLFRFHYVWKA